MNVARLRCFFQDWGMAIFLGMAALLMLGMWFEDQRVIAAKERIARDRASIAETKDRVIRIEKRLLFSDVPDRLQRIEKSIGTAVVENKQAIDRIDEQQKKVAVVLEKNLGVPVEAIEGSDGPRAGIPEGGRP